MLLTPPPAFGSVYLIAEWPHTDQTSRYFVTDQPATAQSWRRDRQRFWVEPFFRDWKSSGFDLEASQLEDPASLEALLVGRATASRWLFQLGQGLTQTGQRHLLSAAHKPD